MTDQAPKSAAARREDLQAKAAAMGVDDAYISLLVDTFYSRVREHETLGPIFENAIGDDWAPHLATMKDFWASVAFNAGRYSGRPVPAHMKHKQIEPQHFNVWLGLFEQALKDTAPTPAVPSYFMERAERIAKSLQLALFGVPGIGSPKY